MKNNERIMINKKTIILFGIFGGFLFLCYYLILNIEFKVNLFYVFFYVLLFLFIILFIIIGIIIHFELERGKDEK